MSSTGTFKGPFGYGGAFGYQEDASGLKLLGHRYYDSGAGRFLSRDPARDGRNWYAYCGNDPIRKVDPSGLLSIDEVRNFCIDLRDKWRDFGDAWGGQDYTDPNGHPVRVGGFPSLINPAGNGMTYGGTIHLADPKTYNKYLDSPHWQDHEEGHIEQDFGLGKHGLSYLVFYLLALVEEKTGAAPPSQGGPPGHDGNPWESLADRYADEKGRRR